MGAKILDWDSMTMGQLSRRAKLSDRHFRYIARLLQATMAGPDRERYAKRFASEFVGRFPRFRSDVFFKDCGLDMYGNYETHRRVHEVPPEIVAMFDPNQEVSDAQSISGS